jgi:hypothetical protein
VEVTPSKRSEPADPVRTFPVKVRDGRVLVEEGATAACPEPGATSSQVENEPHLDPPPGGNAKNCPGARRSGSVAPAKAVERSTARATPSPGKE